MESLFSIIGVLRRIGGLRCRLFPRLLRLICVLALLPPGLSARAQPEEGETAELRISGYGFFGNRELRRLVALLEIEEEPAFYHANFIEDAVLIMMARVHSDGYLRPLITAELELLDGTVMTYQWEEAVLAEPLPRPLHARLVEFQIERGVLYHYESIEFEGLTEIDEGEARRFFVETGGLLPLRRPRIYTPKRLEQGLDSLLETLARRGYENPQATVARLDVDEETGRVNALIRVREGRKSIVRSIREETYFEEEAEPRTVRDIHPEEPYSRLWEQDYAQAVRTNFFQMGYPDTRVEIRLLRRERENDLVHIDLLSRTYTGPQISLGRVRFEGHERTRESMMRRQVRLRPGEPLDRIAVERGRHRLARLGVFDRVELRYDQVNETTRDVVYGVEEGRRMDLSMLFGYGSFEMLRAGVEFEQFNVLGRAHHSRLRAIQSLRSSSADYLYTMPEFFGEDFEVFFAGSGLLRRELEFTRRELTAGAGARTFLRPLRSDVSVRYNYQVLQAARTEVDLREGLARATVSSVIFDLRHDRRDNPLFPRGGYKVLTSLEIASDLLGGEVNFQRAEVSGSYHLPVRETTWVHLGILHGVVLTVGPPSEDLPFNKRFFPGGEGTVRGYQFGEAAPRNEEGRLVGAESYVLGNVELEQALAENWSIVGFMDAVGFAREIRHYPLNDALFSAGGGIRWRSLIGPVRLEYGHNLNPRPRDPSGTIHFSIGFPF